MHLNFTFIYAVGTTVVYALCTAVATVLSLPG